jgi:hypothetical protein
MINSVNLIASFKTVNLFPDKCSSLLNAIILALDMIKNQMFRLSTINISSNLIKLFLKLFTNQTIVRKSLLNIKRFYLQKSTEVIITK